MFLAGSSVSIVIKHIFRRYSLNHTATSKQKRAYFIFIKTDTFGRNSYKGSSHTFSSEFFCDRTFLPELNFACVKLNKRQIFISLVYSWTIYQHQSDEIGISNYNCIWELHLQNVYMCWNNDFFLKQFYLWA